MYLLLLCQLMLDKYALLLLAFPSFSATLVMGITTSLFPSSSSTILSHSSIIHLIFPTTPTTSPR